jgi:hypothetical protein
VNIKLMSYLPCQVRNEGAHTMDYIVGAARVEVKRIIAAGRVLLFGLRGQNTQRYRKLDASVWSVPTLLTCGGSRSALLEAVRLGRFVSDSAICYNNV